MAGEGCCCRPWFSDLNQRVSLEQRFHCDSIQFQNSIENGRIDGKEKREDGIDNHSS